MESQPLIPKLLSNIRILEKQFQDSGFLSTIVPLHTASYLFLLISPAFGNPGSETAKPWISVAVTHFRPVFTMAGLTPKDPVV